MAYARAHTRLPTAIVPVALPLFASLYSHINIGIWHVPIIYPFLAVGSAYSLSVAWRACRQFSNGDLAGIGSAAVL